MTSAIEALKPFADYADPRRKLPEDFTITMGSSFGRRQLTMGDCYRAHDVLNAQPKPRLWKHKTRGHVYEEVFRGTLQMSGTTHDMKPAIIYRHIGDGSIWVRKESEFMDGRFEEVKSDG